MSTTPVTDITANITAANEIITDSTNIGTDKSSKKFDLKILRDSFVNCIQEDNTLLLSEYTRAYEELCVFVASLGAIFEWATRDLSFKLLILREHLRLDPVNYRTIQSMISYEVESGRTKTRDTQFFVEPGKPLPNGCRTLLRLHRALAFLAAFLSEMRTATDDASSATFAWNAYSATLGRLEAVQILHYLIFIHIRAAIKLTIPNRQELIDKLLCKATVEEIDRYTEEIIRSCNIIERTTQELFEANNLTKLP